MNSLIDRGKFWLLGVFVLACAATIAYQAWAIWPMQKCERSGSWWSAKYHQCDTPFPIWRFTGHLPTPPKAPASPAAAKPA
jgi:hypothetical protein